MPIKKRADHSDHPKCGFSNNCNGPDLLAKSQICHPVDLSPPLPISDPRRKRPEQNAGSNRNWKGQLWMSWKCHGNVMEICKIYSNQPFCHMSGKCVNNCLPFSHVNNKNQISCSSQEIRSPGERGLGRGSAPYNMILIVGGLHLSWFGVSTCSNPSQEYAHES